MQSVSLFFSVVLVPKVIQSINILPFTKVKLSVFLASTSVFMISSSSQSFDEKYPGTAVIRMKAVRDRVATLVNENKVLSVIILLGLWCSLHIVNN